MPKSEYISHSQFLLQYLLALDMLTGEERGFEPLPEKAVSFAQVGESECST